jgi:hypothetical protein
MTSESVPNPKTQPPSSMEPITQQALGCQVSGHLPPQQAHYLNSFLVTE